MSRVIEIEVQNETHQTQARLRFAAVPRIGEGLRLQEPDGMWASYDVLDVWYQKAEFGDVWVPFIHVRITVGEAVGQMDGKFAAGAANDAVGVPAMEHGMRTDTYDPGLEFQSEAEPFKI